LYFAITGGVHGGTLFWRKLSEIFQSNGVIFLFALICDEQIALYSIVAKSSNKEKCRVIYCSDDGGFFDSIFRDSDQVDNLFEKSKELYLSHLSKRTATIGKITYRQTTPTTTKSNLTNQDIIEGFLDLVKCGQIQQVKDYLDKGMDINAKNRFDETALFIAASAGHFELVKCFCSLGADINAKNCVDESVMTVAAFNNHDRILTHLLEKGVDPDTRRMCFTPLYDNADDSKLAVVKSLLTAGADPNKRCDGYYTPLMRAATGGHLEVMRELIRAGARKTLKGNRLALNKAAENGHLKAVKLLIEVWNLPPDPKPKKDQFLEESPLQLAAENGHLEIIRYLVNKGADIEYSNGNGTALSRAAREGKKEAVRLLLELGADPNGMGRDKQNKSLPPLRHAIGLYGSGNVEVIELLVRAGAEVNYVNLEDEFVEEASCALMASVAHNQLEVVRYLLSLPEVQVDLTRKNTDKCTPLILAAYKGYLEMVKLLVEKGANVRHISSRINEHMLYNPIGSLTALYQAVKHNHLEVADYLLTAGADNTVKSVSELNSTWIEMMESKYAEE
jgi:ankyrin repeat protein